MRKDKANNIRKKIKAISISMRWYYKNQLVKEHREAVREWLFILGQCERLLFLANFEEEKEKAWCYWFVGLILTKISNKWRGYLTGGLNYWYSSN